MPCPLIARFCRGCAEHPRTILTDGRGRPLEGERQIADVADRAFDQAFRRAMKGGR